MAVSPFRRGALDRRIVIEQLTETRDPDSGALLREWTPLRTIWASKMPLTAKEVARAAAAMPSVSEKFMVRWAADITRQMRIAHNGQRYEITGVEEIGRREGLFLYGSLIDG